MSEQDEDVIMNIRTIDEARRIILILHKDLCEQMGVKVFLCGVIIAQTLILIGVLIWG